MSQDNQVYEGPVDIPDPGGPKDGGVSTPMINRGIEQEMYSLIAEPQRRAAPSQCVILHNTDPDQTRIFQDRLRNGIVLLPGQKREIDMLVEEIARLRYLGRSDRVSTSLATRWASRYRRIR